MNHHKTSQAITFNPSQIFTIKPSWTAQTCVWGERGVYDCCMFDGGSV